MIIIKNREMLIPNNERYIGTTYDNESENRLFQIPRYSQRGVDLAALTFRLDLKYANGSTDTVLLSKEVTDDFIMCTWEITSSQYQVPGTLYIGIRATDGEAVVKWSTYTACVYVERHLNTPGTYSGDLTEIEQMEQDHVYMKHVIGELETHLDYRRDAEAWAVGTRDGEAVSSDDETYHNNSKYYKDQTEEMNHVSEAYAKGTVEGVAVESGDIGYQDNSLYYKSQAASSAAQAASTVATLSAQFDNAMSALTVDSELQDVRVGADGTTYGSAGTAVRTQVSDLRSDLVHISNQPDLTWVIGSSIGSDGVIGLVSSYAYSSPVIVDGGSIRRSTPYRDANSKILLIHVCQYDASDTFISRTTLGENGTIDFESNTKSIRFNFGRNSTLGIPMTAEDISSYFSEKVYRKASLEIDQYNRLISYSVTEADASDIYNSSLENLPANTYVWTSRTYWNDAPEHVHEWFYIISLANIKQRGSMSSLGTQIIFFPDTGTMLTRRIRSGEWTNWVADNRSSMPVYRAFGDSVTTGSVWDTDPDTSWYQAEPEERIPTRIAHAIGSCLFYNQAEAGARFVQQGESDTSSIIGDIIKATDFSNCHLVTIGGGRNDSATELGDGETATANDGTICGAIVDILNYLTNNYPKLQIAVYGVTPQPTSASHAPEHIFTREFAGGWSLATYYTEVAKVCARFNVPFIDWYECALMLQWGQLSGGYSSGIQNWSHPISGDIYTQMGNYLGGKISKIYRG